MPDKEGYAGHKRKRYSSLTSFRHGEAPLTIDRLRAVPNDLNGVLPLEERKCRYLARCVLSSGAHLYHLWRGGLLTSPDDGNEEQW